MADRTSQLVLSALSRAAAAPAGVPLHPNKLGSGLFPSSSAGRQAAARCLAEGYLRPIDASVVVPSGHVALDDRAPKLAAEPFVLTDKGLSFLLAESSPRPVLEDFVRVLEARVAQAAELLAVARQMQAEFAAFRAHAEQVLARIREPGYVWPPEADDSPIDLETSLLDQLEAFDAGQASGDCPLPELFKRLAASQSGLTLGRFHDALRRLHDEGRVYLHPWTGPLQELPEPAFALLIGHLVGYYASVRC